MMGRLSAAEDLEPPPWVGQAESDELRFRIGRNGGNLTRVIGIIIDDKAWNCN